MTQQERQSISVENRVGAEPAFDVVDTKGSIYARVAPSPAGETQIVDLSQTDWREPALVQRRRRRLDDRGGAGGMTRARRR